MAAELVPGRARAALARARRRGRLGARRAVPRHRRRRAGRRARGSRRSPASRGSRWPPDRTAAFWGLVARGSQGGPITLRLGVLGDGVDETIDLLAHDLDEGLLSRGRRRRDDPLDRRRAGRAAAGRAPRRRGPRDPHDPRARALAGAARAGPLRSLPGGRGAAGRAGCGTRSTRASACRWRSRARVSDRARRAGCGSDDVAEVTATGPTTPRSIPASTAASACPPAPPISPPATRPTALAGASCSCARSSAASRRPTDAALVQHLDACLGCLGCEPVCPSGVGYGQRHPDGARAALRARAGSRRSRRWCSASSGASGSGARCSR